MHPISIRDVQLDPPEWTKVPYCTRCDRRVRLDEITRPGPMILL
jgi:hypothetical protein